MIEKRFDDGTTEVCGSLKEIKRYTQEKRLSLKLVTQRGGKYYVTWRSRRTMRVYYSHCQALYNTAQERRDIELLERLGFEVVNPRDLNSDDMKDYMDLVDSCEVVAFRALPDGTIPAGVAEEIGGEKPVIELPSFCARRILTVAETRQYLREVGQR